MERKKRIVIAKPGLDGHDRGAKVVARSLADAGFEVIYTGKFQTPAQIVSTAIQENADGIGVSILSGAHLTMFKKIMDLLREKNAADIVLFGGGIIMDDDIPKLKDMGVAEIFTPGTSTSKIVEFVKNI
ncbi:MAG: cobalamin B12-binding domain-containing protein [Deltaproteobacteria bacterium]|nr:cobalamin B12-binding domain-containing protein [Deltaproteobacteria bacterium]